MNIDKNIPVTIEAGGRKIRVVENDDSTVSIEVFPIKDGEKLKKLLMYPDGSIKELN